MASNAERQRAWRERRKAAGLSTHPHRQRDGYERPRSEHERSANAAHRKPIRPWCFVDTEGANDPAGVYGDPGRQHCFTITAAADDGFTAQLFHGRPLRTSEILHWILGLPKAYKFGGFFFGYDIDQILWQLPERELRRLHGSKLPRGPARYGRYLVGVFNGQLTVCLPAEPIEGEPDELLRVRGRRRVIWDVGRFYQSRLVTAIEDWQAATDEEAAVIERMKSERGSFDLDYWGEHAQAIIDYSLLENRIAARLQSRFDLTMRELGYPLTRWYGAGSVAKSMLHGRGVKDHLAERRPMRARTKTLAADFVGQLPYAYFGGRFEIREPGEINEPIYEYDLRSAYPASYQQLPCLVHGVWRPYPKKMVPEQIGPHDLVLVHWHCADADVWGPFPYRDSAARICYPQIGWDHPVWGEELNSALRIWRRTSALHGRRRGICPVGGWAYETRCDCQPFGWIAETYQQRRALGKDRKGWALKLGMNAAYGTFASSLGAAYDRGRFVGDRGGDFAWCEPRWAGQITAWSRARLLDALAAAGGAKAGHVLMFATDAIYTTAPIELDLVDQLGGWEAHEYPDGGLLIQAGIYHLRGQQAKSKLRGRGIDHRDVQESIDRFYQAWRRDGTDATVTLTLAPRYQGVRLMLHRGTLEKAQRWEAITRTLSFDPEAKREYRQGGWRPRQLGLSIEDLFGGGLGRRPNPRFQALIEREPFELDEPEIELLIGQLQAASQPQGPYAY